MFRSGKSAQIRVLVNQISTRRNRFSSLGNAYQPKNIEGKQLVRRNDPTGLTEGVFTMIFPPPNVTGNLHLGHTLTATIQDVIARRQREKNQEVLWIPGMDHAGIATQVVVEKKLMQERAVSRYDLGREAFLAEVLKWKNLREKDIRENLKSLGLSFSWEREYYTMDEMQCTAVRRAFIDLHTRGLIYRDRSLVNWSCALESAISDIEIDNLEVPGPMGITVPGYEKSITFGELTDVAYKVLGEEFEEIIVSTTRPETILGDVAVAVHPQDEKYAKFHGKDVKLWHPFREIPIPLIFDESVDKDFGTGAVKITPSHDRNDFLLAKRHNLPHIDVIDGRGMISEGFGVFSSLPRFSAREKVKESLAELNLLRQIKPHSMILPRCSRSGDIVEYLIRPQWYLKCQEVAQKAVEAVRSGGLKINPPEKEAEWFRWLENCTDWCISRQIWWGHRIPAYKCTSGSATEWISALSLAEAIEKARSVFPEGKIDAISRDSDVLDTWFSSGLLPFSVFGWPGNTDQLQKYFPLNLMETGHDILFFWVARMTMLSLMLTGEIPFREVLLHGIICDSQGRKMSKSLGNALVPEQIINGATLKDLIKQTELFHRSGIISDAEMERSIQEVTKTHPNGIPECGIDALRFTLCSSNIKSHFVTFDTAQCHANKLFFNKIWQATKFTIKGFENINPTAEDLIRAAGNPSEMDKWILRKLSQTEETVRMAIDQYNFHVATTSLKTFFYSNFCDVYLETTKPNLNAKNPQAFTNLLTLRTCLHRGLKLMEFFTPFLTQELLNHLPEAPEIPNLKLLTVGEHVEEILKICATIRETKSRNGLTKKDIPQLILWADSSLINHLRKHEGTLKTLTMIPEIEILDDRDTFNAHNCSIKSTALHFCCFGIKTTANLKANPAQQKLTKLMANLEKLQAIVADEGYQRSAPESKKEKHREQIKRLTAEIKAIREL